MRNLLTLLTLMLATMPAWAFTPTTGRAYQLVNVRYQTAARGGGPGQKAICVTADAADMNQFWQVTNSGTAGTYYLRNLRTGLYLNQASSSPSVSWNCVETPTSTCRLELADVSGGISVRAAGQPYYLHCDASSDLVNWSVGDNDASKWSLNMSAMTEAEVNEAIKKAEALSDTGDAKAMDNALNAIFADKACTKLNPTYQNMSASALASDANYKALPSALQAMVLKVQKGDWSETSGGASWDSEHAKKYRVQSYEPFSEGEAAAAMTGTDPYTNMNNPTGIISTDGQLFVMVEGTIKEGATLYIGSVPGVGMQNDPKAGTELKEGLNVIPVYDTDALQYVYYVVNTYDASSKTRIHKLSDYPDIKIHIEGGAVNGFFNYIGDDLYAPDTQEDLAYCMNRARHKMFDLIGEFVILHFHLFDTNDMPDGSGRIQPGLKTLLSKAGVDTPTILKAWDDMCFTERLILGVQPADQVSSARSKGYFLPLEPGDIAPYDQYEYFNNRLMGITKQGDLYMYATWWHTAYNVSTMNDILLEFNKGGCIWGPAHEYGHNNQNPMKIAGSTEVSNNLFSNVAVYYQGLLTSRAAYPSTLRNDFNKGMAHVQMDIWSRTRMYFQMFLYYHVAGHNKKFYPTLYELLRQNPINHPYDLNPRYDQLQFAKMCCEAAHEDLTDFFDAWGMFVPLKDYRIDDYSQFNANLTEEDAEAVRREIAEMGYPKNHALLLIDDRPGSSRQSWSNEWNKNLCGEYGGVYDFISGAKPSDDLKYRLSGTEITVSGGNGGVGFITFDENGRLISFSNDKGWSMSPEAAWALSSGRGHLYAVGSDNTLTEVFDAAAGADITELRSALMSLLAQAGAEIAQADKEGRRVGWYKAAKTAPLSERYDEAKGVYDDKSATAQQIIEQTRLLSDAYYALTTDPDARLKVRAGNIYRLVNRAYDDDLTANSAGTYLAVAGKSETDPSHQWKFMRGASEGEHCLLNPQTGKYIQSVSRSTKIALGSTPVSFTLAEVELPYLALACGGDESKCIHVDASADPVGWSANEKPSKWQLILCQSDAAGFAREELKDLIDRTDALVDETGKVSTVEEEEPLTTANFDSNAKCTETSYGDQFTSWDVLIDGNVNTFFHSNYAASGSTDGGDHYLQVNLDNEIEQFRFTYTTRPSGNLCAPTDMSVSYSADGKSWHEIQRINSGLPTGGGAVYVSVPYSLPEAASHLRLTVHSTTSGQSVAGHQYFVMSEFGLMRTEFSATPSDKYLEVEPWMLVDAYRESQHAAATADSDTATAEELRDALASLQEAYDTLLAAAVSGVELLNWTLGTKTIYDLQGRRVREITAPGIYILDGRKVVVR